MSDEFYDDKILLTFYETLSFSLLTTSAKLIIFNVMKLYEISTQTGLMYPSTAALTRDELRTANKHKHAIDQ